MTDKKEYKKKSKYFSEKNLKPMVIDNQVNEKELKESNIVKETKKLRPQSVTNIMES